MASIDLGGDGLDMYPEETRTVASAIGTEGAAIHAAFDARIGEIGALDSQLGNGPLGENAARQYNPFVDSVRGQMDQMKPQIQKKAENGELCVDKYVEQDQINKQNIHNSR
jgi:hypothetical protein